MRLKIRFKSTCFYSILISFLLLILQVFCVALMFTLTNSQVLSYFLGYLLTILIIGYKYRKKLLEDIKNFKSSVNGNIKHLIVSYVVSILLMYIANYVLYYIFGNISGNEQSIREILFTSPLLMGISFGLFGPIIEELSFRYPYRDAKNKLLNFCIYTFIFALMHITGEFNLVTILYIIPYLFLSIGISYPFYKTNNIYTSMIAHIFNNLFSIIIILTFGG